MHTACAYEHLPGTGTFSYVNNVPLIGTDMAAANGIIYRLQRGCSTHPPHWNNARRWNKSFIFPRAVAGKGRQRPGRTAVSIPWWTTALPIWPSWLRMTRRSRPLFSEWCMRRFWLPPGNTHHCHYASQCCRCTWTFLLPLRRFTEHCRHQAYGDCGSIIYWHRLQPAPRRHTSPNIRVFSNNVPLNTRVSKTLVNGSIAAHRA